MNTISNDDLRKLATIVAMVALGGVLVAVIGEAAKYVMPHEALYYLLVNKVYIMAAAIFLLLLGVNRVNANNVRNMIAVFVLVLIGLVVLWQLDGIASGILWNGMYPTVYGRISEHAVGLFLQSLDVLGLVIGAVGAFLVLMKVLDLAKDKMGGTTKNS
ncbi:MAG: hypothetical protein A4E28_02248 [Methanocella sp. PtaU1.Bin125]|nr:MAG: hypothetical protein A4E28_02248 [Methanocella sp. PtaU1.Bin125]